MNYDEFIAFIDAQEALFKSLRRPDESHRESVLANTVKISEEFGELCDAILESFGDQRKGKMDEHEEGDDELRDELADVLITVFLLAKRLDINVMDALERKITKIHQKHNKEFRGE